jgi:hypothetical protein
MQNRTLLISFLECIHCVLINHRSYRTNQSNNNIATLLMMKTFEISLFFLLCLGPRKADGKKETHDLSILFSDLNAQPCHENGVVASWCDSAVMEVECVIHPGSDVYACRCSKNPSACPEECITENLTKAQSPLPPVKTHHGIMCYGIPKDEPNYILKSDPSHLPLHHCENNALVASWCNEATLKQVNCLLLPALDEYVCTCLDNAAACPSECVGGDAPDRKTKHAVRCQGIPVDTPNYILE